jgi:hypothetical protein
MAYNYLKTAKSIRNTTLCLYDTLIGFSSDFTTNGDVGGWDIYNNIYLYGCWDNTLFGTSYKPVCFIQRTNNFISLEAEDYYIIELVMKITPDPDRPYKPTQGKIMWLRTDDNVWDDNKSILFDLKLEPNWQRYQINLGPAQWWQGYINNLRIYPFIDGHEKCMFAFKLINIKSLNKYSCTQTQCDYYTKYKHPCLGSGRRGGCVSALNKLKYTTISGVSDTLMVAIDNYGDYEVTLGTNLNVGIEIICNKIEYELTLLSLGGYNFAEVSSTIDNKIKILSGTVSSDSTVHITGGTAAQELGFLDDAGRVIYTNIKGKKPASHYDYASSVKLGYSEIVRLLGEGKDIVYSHKPDEYNIEGGNKDFYYSISSNRVDKATSLYHTTSISNTGTTIIDVSHPITNNGIINAIYINCGKVRNKAYVYILRPKLDGTYLVVDRVLIPQEIEGGLYTQDHTTQYIPCHILVSKGDVLAVYNVNIYAAISQTQKNIDACFFRLPGKPEGIIKPTIPKATGTIGFHVFCHSFRKRDSLILDIDFGQRVNLNNLYLKGEEYIDKFEYNVAICEDVSWYVDCRGEDHVHNLLYCSAGSYFERHKNIPFGVDCLSDGIITLNGGKQGDAYTRTSDGIVTLGKHTYFYVNGDGEWAFNNNSSEDAPIFEFYLPPFCQHAISEYTYDPIHFVLRFPYKAQVKIHKSRMFFKEGKNFKHFSLQYYVSGAIAQQTGEYVGYHYIPKYNNIVLDSVVYDSASFGTHKVNDDVEQYLFANPTAWPEPIYSGDKCINWSIVLTARNLTWNTLEHNFDVIEAAGFRCIVDYHVSTKMTEFEVYSSFPVEPGLVDNALLDMSVDGHYWQASSFEYTEDPTVIKAAVNMAPRFLRLHIFSQGEFSLYNIYTTVTESVQTDSCTSEVLLDFSENNYISDVATITFKNTYGSLANFTVALPQTYTGENTKVVDIDFSKYKESDSDNILIHKNKDLYIELEHNQVANNCPVYGLCNLIDNKKAYITDNTTVTWTYHSTLEKGKSLNLTFDKVTDLYFTVFEKVNSRYFILTSEDPYSYNISSITCIIDGKIILPKCYYFGTVLKDIPTGTYISFKGAENSENITTKLQETLVFEDHFSQTLDYNYWSVVYTENIYGNRLDLLYIATYGDYGLYPKVLLKDTFIGVTTSFTTLGCFKLDTWLYCGNTQYKNLTTRYDFSYNDELVFYFELINLTPGNKFILYTKDGVVLYVFQFTYYNLVNIQLSRKNEDFVLKIVNIEDHVYVDTIIKDIDITPVNKLTCRFISTLDTNNIDIYIGAAIVDVKIFSLPFVSSNDSVILDFGSNLVLDRMIIAARELIEDITLLTTHDEEAACYPLNIIYTHHAIFYREFAINLEQEHKLSIIRNYGSMPNKIRLSLNSAYVLYSSSITDNPEEVDWGLNYDKSLILFEDTVGTTTFKDSLDDSRVLISTNAIISNLKSRVGLTSCYFDGLASLLLTDNDQAFTLNNQDFSIFAFYFLGSNIYEEHFLAGKWDLEEDAQSYMLGISKDKKLFFRYKNTNNIINTYYTNISIEVGKWFCFEVSRRYWYVYLFVDGTLDSIHPIEVDTIKDSSNNFYLGSYNLSAPDNLYGYIDYFFTRLGAPLHVNTYNVDVFLDSQSQLMYNEYKWVKFKIPSTSVFALDTLGIYPDIQRSITCKGHKNCQWDSLGTSLTNYVNNANDVALHAYRVVASSFIFDALPKNVINGVTEINNFHECWGFTKEDLTPEITLYFDEVYLIDKIVLYHGTKDTEGYITNDFVIQGYPTVSGTDFTEIVNVQNNTAFVSTHTFTPIFLHKIRMVITRYTSGNLVVPAASDEDLNGEIVLDGGFIKEIEVYTYEDKYLLSSENYPIICMDLNYQFNVSSFRFDYKGKLSMGAAWLYYAINNLEDFIYYSDSAFTDPEKVTFATSKEKQLYFSYPDIVDMETMTTSRKVLGSHIYLDAATYTVMWEAYDNTGDKSFYLEVAGPGGVDKLYPNVEGPSSWSHQVNLLSISYSGFYDINFVVDTTLNTVYTKKISTIYITHYFGYVKWLAFVDDTATDYAFDNNASYKKAHYMYKCKVYADGTFPITEYPCWWATRLATLSSNSVSVLEGKSTLEINYPTSSGIDYVMYREGDSFKRDPVWLEKDFLSFWLFINEIANLDTTYGSIGFGNPTGINPNKKPNEQDNVAYAYGWSLDKLDLVTGWNYIKLYFGAPDFIMPSSASQEYDHKFNARTNIRNNFTIGFIMYFRGTGKGPLIMYLDKIKIERNLFEEKVFDKQALCISYGEFAEVNLSNLTIDKGTISLDMKMYNDSSGVTKFGALSSRTFFTVSSNDNDILILGVRQGSWLEFGVGDAWSNYIMFALSQNALTPNKLYLNYDESFHICVMWDNDGGMSNGDSFRLYLNDLLVWYSNMEHWDVSSYNVNKFVLGGGAPVTAFRNWADGAAVFGSLKIYNYCLEDTDYNLQDMSIQNKMPEDYIYISIDGINYYDRHYYGMPLTVSGVLPGEEVTVYVKSIKNKDFINLKNKSPKLLVDWIVTV